MITVLEAVRPRLALVALAAVVVAGALVPATEVFAAGAADDMYIETPPDPTGDGEPTRDLGSGDPNVVPAATADALEGMGESGQAALRAAQRTAPRIPVGATPAEPQDGSALGGLISPLLGSGSMGLVLPLILLGALVAAILFAARRRTGGGA